MLYDFKTQKWAVWADEGHTVGFPNWSRDSRYVYFDWFFGKDQSYRRVEGGGEKCPERFCVKGGCWGFDLFVSAVGLALISAPAFFSSSCPHDDYRLCLARAPLPFVPCRVL